MRHPFAHHAAAWLEALYRGLGASDLAYRLALQPRRATVSRHRVVTGQLAAGTTIRIVFASDFHAGGVTSAALLKAACQTIEELAPDLLLLGGDFVSTRSADASDLVRRLAAHRPACGTYAVLGNHDHYAGADRIARILARAGITLLQNTAMKLALPHETIWLCGLDDYNEGKRDALGACAGTGGLRIVLMHSPESMGDLANLPFNLAFCGHTHGGQIALPGGKPILLPKGRLVRMYQAGAYSVNVTGTLIVSRGIGCDFLPVRLFAPSEVILCELAGSGVAGKREHLPGAEPQAKDHRRDF